MVEDSNKMQEEEEQFSGYTGQQQQQQQYPTLSDISDTPTPRSEISSSLSTSRRVESPAYFSKKNLSIREPPRIPELIHFDVLLNEMKWMSSCFITEFRTKIKLNRAVALAAVKFCLTKNTRQLKQREDEEKRLKNSARSIALAIKQFWKVVESLVTQQLQSKLRTELRAEKEAKQLELVAEATKFAQAISTGLERWDSGMDPLMITTKETPKFKYKKSDHKNRSNNLNYSSSLSSDKKGYSSASSYSSNEDKRGWAEQAEEDFDLDNAVPDERLGSDLDSEEELALLQTEAEMDLGQLVAEFGINESQLAKIRNPSSPGSFDSESTSSETLKDIKREKSPEDTNINKRAHPDDDDAMMHSKRSKRRRRRHRRRFDDEQDFCSPLVVPPKESNNAGPSNNYRIPRKRSSSELPTTSDSAKANELLLLQHQDSSDICYKREEEENKFILKKKVEKDKEKFSKKMLKCDKSNSGEESKLSTPIKKKRIDKKNLKKNENSKKMVFAIPGLCPVPFLLRATLRTYQHEGMTWLLTLHDNNANGILADEMGLGKTIQTISLLAYLACYRGIWGPHLIIVPSSVLLNWEIEFQRFLPGFRILSYYGGRRERERKRQGWSDENAFNVCIVSYALVVADAHMFKRKAWYYIVLDEAQNIKNYQSQKWQTLLNFNSQRRLLLTGTPLQNDLTELWALMHFLMPDLFESHSDWKETFSDPLTRAIESASIEKEQLLVTRLHDILRPFLLRRLKRDVECQMPSKFEHVVRCYLSKRQRALYDEFIESKATKTSMESNDYFSLLNVLMQLRKVCNHPDLLVPRDPVTQFGGRSSLIRPTIEVPRCVDLSLNSPFYATTSERMQRLRTDHWLCSVATSEQRNIGRPTVQRWRSDSHDERKIKERDMSCDKISRVPLITVVGSTTETYQKDETDNSKVNSHIQSSTIKCKTHSAVSIQNKESPLNPMSSLDDEAFCSICDTTCQTLRTPLKILSVAADVQESLPATTSIDKKFSQEKNGNSDCEEDLLKSDLQFASSIVDAPESPPLHPLTTTTNNKSSLEKSPCRSYLVLQSEIETCTCVLESEENLSFTGDAHSSDILSRKSDGTSNQNPATGDDYLFSKVECSAASYSEASMLFEQPYRSYFSCIPNLLEYMIKALNVPETISHPSRSVCPHSCGSAGYTTTSSLPQLTMSPNLPLSLLPEAGSIPLLDALSIQLDKRLPNRHWLTRSRSVLKNPPFQPLDEIATSRPVLCKKALFEKAIELNADPRGEIGPEAAYAGQFAHLAASVIGTLRRSPNLEYLTCHPPADDDPYLRGPARSKARRLPSMCSEMRSSTITSEPRDCIYGINLREKLRFEFLSRNPAYRHVIQNLKSNLPDTYIKFLSPVISDLFPSSPVEVMEKFWPTLQHLICICTPTVTPLGPQIFYRGIGGVTQTTTSPPFMDEALEHLKEASHAYHQILGIQQCQLPLRSSLQDDCGKMKYLAILLHKLRREGHKCILFTQMSRMLDILEGFLNLHTFTYVRLDGGTKVELRQKVVDRFNEDTRIFIFMASTRAGGVGLNLTGADSVIFYDTDWNPAMDRQAMDRCHRIGQTRDVHVYRLITEATIEENILRKQLMKRMLDDIVVDQGKFNTRRSSDFFDKTDVREMLTTRIDASDLYVTRVLHESISADSTTAKAQTPGIFEQTLAQVEDADDQIGETEPAMIQIVAESESDNDEDSFTKDSVTRSSTPSISILNTSAAAPILFPQNGLRPIDEPLPFWVCHKRKKNIDSEIIDKRRIDVDEGTSIYVTDIVKYALNLVEKNMPETVLAEISQLQQRLNIFRATQENKIEEEGKEEYIVQKRIVSKSDDFSIDQPKSKNQRKRKILLRRKTRKRKNSHEKKYSTSSDD